MQQRDTTIDPRLVPSIAVAPSAQECLPNLKCLLRGLVVPSTEQTGCSDDKRFLLELEFVQCLSSPQYLNWLAQNRWFDDTAFLNYLKYLQYWQQPEYSRFIIYPHCLFFLKCLQEEDFRAAVIRNEVKEMLHSQQLLFWQHHRNNGLAASTEAQGDTDAS